jgi:AraC-like DNA-binding protein
VGTRPARTNNGILFTFRMIPMISAELARRSLDSQPLLAEAGLPGDALRGEITAPLARIQLFIELAAKAMNAELFGLDLAERIPPGAYGVAEFLVRSAPSIEVGLRALCDFAALINPIGRFHFTHAANEGELHYTVPAQRDTLGEHLNEYTIAYILRQFSAVLGEPIPLTRAWFSHSRREHAETVARRLGASVRFQAADCGFAVSREVLARRPSTADPALHEFLLGQARAQLGRVGPVDIVSQVARVIEVRLPQGEVGASDIARAMATTVRSLQRHLAEAGTAYRDVLMHVRLRRRAELRQGGIADGEISRQLGFADARSMRRSLDETSAD